jgi:hypothetical protein
MRSPLAENKRIREEFENGPTSRGSPQARLLSDFVLQQRMLGGTLEPTGCSAVELPAQLTHASESTMRRIEWAPYFRDLLERPFVSFLPFFNRAPYALFSKRS